MFMSEWEYGMEDSNVFIGKAIALFNFGYY